MNVSFLCGELKVVTAAGMPRATTIPRTIITNSDCALANPPVTLAPSLEEGEAGTAPPGISAILHWLPFLFGDLSQSPAGRKEVSPFEVMCA